MRKMFHNAESFNCDLSSWDVSKVGNFQYMFYGATSFNQNLCRFGRIAPSTTLYDLMFHGASSCTSTTKPSSKINTNIVPNYAYVGPFCASECNLVSSIRVLQSYIFSLYYTHNIHMSTYCTRILIISFISRTTTNSLVLKTSMWYQTSVLHVQ